MTREDNQHHNSGTEYVPALRFNWATKFYDGVMRNFVREQTLRQLTVNAIAAKLSERILDFGCGTGGLTVALAKTDDDISVFGYDIDPEVLEIAKNKSSINNLKKNAVFQPF